MGTGNCNGTEISLSLQSLDRSLTGFLPVLEDGTISFSFGKSLGKLVRNILRVQVRTK